MRSTTKSLKNRSNKELRNQSLGATGKEFYLPHKAVIRDDASARRRVDQPSLNDCLQPGPPLQNLLWNVLMRVRFHPVVITGDLQKTFLQIRIREKERDALRFHWKRPHQCNVETYRFTCAPLGLTSFTFLLGGVISQLLIPWEEKHQEIVEGLRRSLYVDNLLTVGTTVEEALIKKSMAKTIFENATFKLRMWHSNVSELEMGKNAPEGQK